MADNDAPINPISLGSFLRTEREKKGLTLEQVASATKISIKHLHYLEADQYVDLPAKPFVRGFVLAYAQFIGLSGKEVLFEYGAFLERKSEERPNRESGHSGYAFERREGEQTRTVLWITLGAFLVVGAIVILLLKPNFKHKRSTSLEKLKGAVISPSPTPSATASGLPSPLPSSSVAPSPSSSASPALVAVPTPTPSVKPTPAPSPTPLAPAPVPTPTPSAKPDPLQSGINLKASEIKHKVIAKALDDVWVRYRSDSLQPMRIVLRKDRILVLRGTTSLVMQASHPERVSVRYNGGREKPLPEHSGATVKAKDLTVAFPPQAIENIDNPFPGSTPVQGISVPAPWRPDAEQ